MVARTGEGGMGGSRHRLVARQGAVVVNPVPPTWRGAGSAVRVVCVKSVAGGGVGVCAVAGGGHQ